MKDTMTKEALRPQGIPVHTPLPAAKPAPADTSITLVPDAAEDAAFFRALEQQGILLNAPQIEAVRHGEGPLLTLAGAGCGKTTVLTARAGYLLSVRKVDPKHILLVTFTTKAAAEMKSRIAALPGVTAKTARAIEARTFHAFGLLLLRRYGNLKDEIFGDARAQHAVLQRLRREIGSTSITPPETLLATLSAIKLEGGTADDLPKDTPEERDRCALLCRYEEWKQEHRRIDFDDILLRTEQLLQDPNLLAMLQDRFRYIMVDEFQDTNRLQYEMVRQLAAVHRNLMVVGDDDQTIYSFNGARQEYILDFPKEYPGTRIIALDINYRSHPQILGLGVKLIARNEARHDKTLQAGASVGQSPMYIRPAHADEEADEIVKRLKKQQTDGRSLGDVAILHRTVSGTRAIAERLLMEDIPFIQYGEAPVFYDHALIRPVMDHLRLSVNSRRMDALPGVIGPLYISRDAGIEHIMQQEQKQAKKYPLIHLFHWERLQSFQRQQVKDRIVFLKKIKEMKPLYAIREIRRVFYDKFASADFSGPATRHKDNIRETLDELESAAGKFATVEEMVKFADELSAKREQMIELMKQEAPEGVHLMTVHRAKGLEFPCVYLLGASEGILPHKAALQEEAPEDVKAGQSVTGPDPEGKLMQAALEEERRIAYVAVTRAKHELYISSPVMHHGKTVPPSRFLLEAFQ
ncbi:ATP-dependent helicase [Paenibacillus wulumuqiensis]|uniref:ATP-dependent helicase n=1 Tax=Paenibacillus wulumuqiensis TaxID=1567107 RepID=UPI000697F958|nr:ATP-dependent helicase [Paenibacillus wulumuqiensis]